MDTLELVKTIEVSKDSKQGLRHAFCPRCYPEGTGLFTALCGTKVELTVRTKYSINPRNCIVCIHTNRCPACNKALTR